MTPLIRHLQETFSALPFSQVEQNPLNWTFTKKLKELGPDFYQKVVSLHLVLNLEYSCLGQQLRAQFFSGEPLNKDKIKEQLIAALMLAELLEYVYQHYLIVPREVARLRQQQNLYRELLTEIIQTLSNEPKQTEVVSSFSQQIRNTTINLNLYRLLVTRSKRALDFFAILDTASDTYRSFVRSLAKYTDPILVHVAWLFYLPRLSVNLFLLIKHTIPWFWMSEQEKSLGWSVRFNAQMQRRWFELGNDIAWVGVGAANCFYLIGALAPVSMYLSIACFAFDVFMAATRAYIELSRLYELRKQYKEMKNNLGSLEESKKLKEHLNAIDKQIEFEQFRLGSHVTTTSLIFLSMACAAPLFAFHPIIPLIGAISLVLICLVNFALVEIVNNKRPRDTLDVVKMGFFAKKEPPTDWVAEKKLDLEEKQKTQLDDGHVSKLC